MAEAIDILFYLLSFFTYLTAFTQYGSHLVIEQETPSSLPILSRGSLSISLS
jgi:hypothetical protein